MIARRSLLQRWLGTCSLVFGYAASAAPAKGCLYGTYRVKCPNGHIDTVEKGTCQHVCETKTCRRQVFRGKHVTVICPAGHDNDVDTAACDKACESYKCRTPDCNRECRIG